MSGTKSTNTDAYSWIGASGAIWGLSSDWADTTTATSPAGFAPGVLTPATIVGSATASPLAINGDGSAFSIDITRNVSLSGTIGVSSALSVGNNLVTSTASSSAAGTLALTGVAFLSTGAVRVVSGGLNLGGSTRLSTTGSITVGVHGGTNIPLNGSYLATDNVLGTISLAGTAQLSATGDLVIDDGALSVAGGSVSIGGAVKVGSEATPPTIIPNILRATGQITVTGGGTLTAGLGITDPGGIVFAGGAGSRIIAAGTFASTSSALYFYANGPVFGGFGASLAAADGAFIRLGGVRLDAPPIAYFSTSERGIIVDATGTIEIGTAGGAAAGAITVDAGRTIEAAASATLSGTLVNNGVVSASGGTLTQSGAVTGIGTLAIGAKATIALSGTVANTETIAFLGGSATLRIASAGSLPYAVAGLITGFTLSDSIILAQSASAVAFSAGTLTVSNAGTLLETLRLSGDFSGKIFTLAPASGGGSQIGLVTQTGTGNDPRSTNSDAYLWAGASGGAWGTAANWTDSTTSTTPAAFVPGTLSPVTIAAGTPLVVNGDGVAASLALTGALSRNALTTVGGGVTIGRATVANTSVTLATGALSLSSGGTLTASTLTLVAGSLQMAAQSSVAISGTISIGTPNGAVVPSGSTYVFTSEGDATVGLTTGAILSTQSSLAVYAGTLDNAGGQVSIAGSLAIGTDATTTAVLPYTYPTTGRVSVTAGGTTSVGGAVLDPGGMVFAAGAGSKFLATGTLQASNADVVSYTAPGAVQASIYFGSAVAADGGFVQLGGAMLSAPASGLLTSYTLGLAVDASSSIEIGTTGGAAAGAITVDAGRSVTANVTANLFGDLVDNGLVTASSGVLTVTGSLTGTGTIAIGRNATLALGGGAAASDTIAFQGTNAVLSLSTAAIASVITGFALSDSIVLAQPATSVAFAPLTGTLLVRNGTSILQSLHLTGDFSGKSFALSQTGTGSAITLVNQMADDGGSSPFYLKSTFVNGAPQLQVWVKSGTSLEAANLVVQYGTSQASYTGFSQAANWNASVTNSGGTVTLALADSGTAAALGTGADALVGTLRFNAATGATDLAASVTATSATNTAGASLGGQFAGSIDIGLQTSLSGHVYDWKSHAAIPGTQVVALSSGNPGDNGQQRLDFHNVHIDSTGHLIADLYADHAAGAQSVLIGINTPTGVTSSFAAAATLPAGWTATAFPSAGSLAVTAGGTTGIYGNVRLGTITWTLPATPSATTLSFQLNTNSIGGSNADLFALTYSSTTTDSAGAYSFAGALAGTAPDRYSLQAFRGASDIGTAITSADALAALRLSVGLNPNAVNATTGTRPIVSAYQTLAADLSGDGHVTSSDALNILRQSVGLTVSTQPKWAFLSETTSLWNAATNGFNTATAIAQAALGPILSTGSDDLAGVLTGDVGGRWVPLDGQGNPIVGYTAQASTAYPGIAAATGAPTDQWGIASYTAFGAIAAASPGSGRLSVIDSSANVAQRLDQLELLARNGQLAGIWLNDQPATTLAVTSFQLAADTTALGLLHGNYTLAAGSTDSVAAVAVLPAASGQMVFLSPTATTPSLVISGTPVIANAANGASVQASLAAAQGIGGGITEVINFAYGASTLNVALDGLTFTDLVASDVSIGGTRAVYLTTSADVSHGIALLGLSGTAADLTANHLSLVGRFAVIG